MSAIFRTKAAICRNDGQSTSFDTLAIALVQGDLDHPHSRIPYGKTMKAA